MYNGTFGAPQQWEEHHWTAESSVALSACGGESKFMEYKSVYLCLSCVCGQVRSALL